MCGMKKPDGKGDSGTEPDTKRKTPPGQGGVFLKEKVKMLEGTMNKIFMFYGSIILHDLPEYVGKWLQEH